MRTWKRFLLAGPDLGVRGDTGRSRIGFGKTWMEPGGSAVTARAGCDWGGLIRGNDDLIGDVGEPAGTGSMPFICLVPGVRDHAGAQSDGPRRNPRGALDDWICLLP